MADPTVKESAKKRQPKPGTRRVTVNLSEESYKELVEVSQAQMREPNNMLSFMLAVALPDMLESHKG
jgi:hypothetical protein